MVFSIEGFKHFKNILHPNIVENSNEYLKNRLYHLPTYHGCGKRNRNGTNKEIDYKRGEHCFFPTERKYWKKKKDYNEKLSLLGICLFLEQTSMQKLKKECGLTMNKTVLNQEVIGLIIMIHTLNITCKIAPCDIATSRRAFDLPCTGSGQLML